MYNAVRAILFFLLLASNSFAMSESRVIPPTTAVWSAPRAFYSADPVNSVYKAPIVLRQAANEGDVEAFDFKTGAKLWERQGYNTNTATVLHPPQSAEVLWAVENNAGNEVWGTPRALVQLDPKTGKEIRRLVFTDLFAKKLDRYSKFFWLSSDLVLHLGFSGEISAVSLKDGSIVWTLPLKNNGMGTISGPFVVGNTVYLTVDSYAQGYLVVKFDLQSGELLETPRQGQWVYVPETSEVLFKSDDRIQGIDVKDEVLEVFARYYLARYYAKGSSNPEYRVYSRKDNKLVFRLKHPGGKNGYYEGLKIFPVANGHDALFYFDAVDSVYSMVDLTTKKKQAIATTFYPSVPIYVNWPYAFLANDPLEVLHLGFGSGGRAGH